MFFSKKSSLIVGLDIGSSAVKIAVGERRADGGLSLVGSHMVEARGVRKGEVINHAEASSVIFQAIQEAEEAMNMEIREVELGLTGGHIESASHRGTVPIRSETHEITEEDVDEAVENARACVLLGESRQMLHIIRQRYFVDGKEVPGNPAGLLGQKLEADVHCVHGIGTRFLNTRNCLQERQETSLEVNNWIFNGLASALAVLGRHEKDLGAIVLDIGAGTTEYVVYAKGMIRQTGVLSVGGDHLVNDLLLGLKLPSRRRAEAIIRDHGSVMLSDSILGKTIRIQTSELMNERERELYLEHIHVILNCRMDEMLRIIHEKIRAQGLMEMVGAGIFLTGGCARMRGLVDLAQSIFEMPACVASPQGFDGQVEHLTSLEMSTAVGLVKYAHIKGRPMGTATGLKGLFRKIF